MSIRENTDRLLSELNKRMVVQIPEHAVAPVNPSLADRVAAQKRWLQRSVALREFFGQGRAKPQAPAGIRRVK